jgi:copper chaperone CopZ
MSTVALTIQGMSCQHCVRAVREALEAVPGVTVSSVDIGSAQVTVDPAQASAEAVAAAVTDAGYDATAQAG